MRQILKCFVQTMFFRLTVVYLKSAIMEELLVMPTWIESYKLIYLFLPITSQKALHLSDVSKINQILLVMLLSLTVRRYRLSLNRLSYPLCKIAGRIGLLVRS